jgi:hypothetical protein
MSRRAMLFVSLFVAAMIVAFSIQYIYNPHPELNLLESYKIQLPK